MSAVVNGRLLVEAFVTLFVIMDPPGTLPIFLALTATAERRERIRAARQAVGVSLLVIVGVMTAAIAASLVRERRVERPI